MQGLVRALVLVVAVAALSVVSCSSDGGSPEAPGGTTIAATGSRAAVPNVAEGTQSHPVLIADGPTIVLRQADGSEREIVDLGDDGSLAAFPVLSPDGATIAFLRRVSFSGTGNADWGDDILLVPSDGGEPAPVRGHPTLGQQISGLAWRPDGDALLFGRVEIGLNDNNLPTSVEGATIVELTIASGVERAIVDGALDPSLSADGGRLTYLSFTGVIGDSTIMVAAGDGSDPRPLAGNDRFEVLATRRISPSGATVVFAAAERLLAAAAPLRGGWLSALLDPLLPRRAEAHGIPMDVWLADAATGEITRLTAIGADDPYPAWSPDEQTITFMAGNGLYEVSVGDASLTRVGGGLVGAQITLAP